MDILIHVGDSADPLWYKDGDVIGCYPFLGTLLQNGQNICLPKKFDYNSAGLRDFGTLLEKYEQKVHKYKYERVNSNEVLITNLLTEEQEIDSSIDLYSVISKMIAIPNHTVFGNEQGKEVWYMKKLPLFGDSAKINSIWDDIEQHTDNLRQNNMRKQFTPTVKQTMLALDCTGFLNNVYTEISKHTACDRSSPITVRENENDETIQTTLIAKRQWKIPYKDMDSDLGIDIDNVLDFNKIVDPRQDVQQSEKNKLDDIMFDKVDLGEYTL